MVLRLIGGKELSMEVTTGSSCSALDLQYDAITWRLEKVRPMGQTSNFSPKLRDKIWNGEPGFEANETLAHGTRKGVCSHI